MQIELAVLAGACGLGLVHIVAASHSASLQRGYRWSASARDSEVPPLTGIAGRLQRASANYAETFPYFVAALMMTEVVKVHDWRTVWGAALYLAARILYLPLYATGVFLVRSLFWNVSILGIAMLIWAAIAP